MLVSSGPYDIFDIVTSYPFQLGKVHFVKPEIKLKIHRPIIQRLHLFDMNYSTRFKVSSYLCKYVTEISTKEKSNVHAGYMCKYL